MGKSKRGSAAPPSAAPPSAALPVVVPLVAGPITPMAAVSVRRLPVGPGWVFEPKFDGFRALAFCDRDGVVLQSRQQRLLTDAFPDLAAALTPFQCEGVVVDGEVVVWRAGRLDFAAL